MGSSVSARKKQISLRLDPWTIEKIKQKDSMEKFGSRIQKILDEYLKNEFFRDDNWLLIPRPLGKFLFESLNEKQVTQYCHMLIEQVIKIRAAMYPKLTLWESWIKIDADWNKNINSNHVFDKLDNNTYNYVMTHNLGKNVSTIIFEMFKYFGKETNAGFLQVHILDDSLAFKLKVK